LIKESLAFIKKYFDVLIVVFILGFLFIIFYKNGSKNRKKENDQKKNTEFVIGQLLRTTNGGRYSVSIRYRYYVNGKEFINTDSVNSSNDDYDKNGFYYVKYQKENPQKSTILIARGKCDYKKLFDKSTTKVGKIDKIIKYRDNFYDIDISYKHLNCNYSFRSRLPIEDLNCDPSLNCLKSNIDLTISLDYPLLNNIYLKSVDRTKKIKSDFKLHVNFECN